jgi:PAS domain S-box-containing protein
MAVEPGPDPIIRLTRSVARSVGRWYFGAAGLVALASLAILAALPPSLSPGGRTAMALAVVAYAAAAGWAYRRSQQPEFRIDGAMFALAAGALGLIAATGVLLGDGARSPVLALMAALVCIVAGLAARAYAWTLAALAAAAVGALALAELGGRLPAPAGSTALWLVVLYQWLAIGCGLAGGILVSDVRARVLRIASERERHFRGLLAMAADGYWEQDALGRFTHVSEDPAAAGQSGPLRIPLGRTPWELTQPGLDEQLLDALRADFELRQPFSGVISLTQDEHGRLRHHSLSGRPRFDAKGSFIGYWGIVRDVTDEIESERARAASEARYRELFTRSPSPLVLHRRGIILDANDAAARLFDLENAAACKGLDMLSLYAEGDSRDRARQHTDMLERLPLGKSTPVNEFQLVSPRGRRLHVQATGVRVESGGGPATLSIYFDITARAAAEAALRRSEALLSLLFATSPDCITLTDLSTGRYLLVNGAFTRVTGYREDEAIGHTEQELQVWNDAADRDRLVRTVRAEGRADEMPMSFRAKSGALASMLVSAARFELDGREHLVINARDVTDADRVRNENAAMLRNASIGIAFTRDSRFVRANPYFERMLGWPEGTLAGQPGSVVWADEEAYAEVGRTIGPALAQGRAVEVERNVRRRDGSLFLCRVLAQALDPADPARGGTIWICEDVTERRQIEHALAAARDAAEAASKAKSAFLANMSHEIRTPLNGLLGLARLARQPELAAARRDQYLAQISDSAQSLSGIISDILDLAKIEAGKIRLEAVPFDLRETLSSVHHGYLPLAEAKGLTLTLRLAADLPQHVIGDAVRLRQILSNYVTNALKFTARGEVEIEAGLDHLGRIHLAVRDTGLGIDAATQARLFAPFTQADESTTRRYGGTGLGLSICRELASLMGGEVGLASEVGHGSIFWAALPLLPTEPAPEWSDTSDVDPEILRGARVLLVEDNPVNMTVAAAMLEQWGVDVVQAVDGRGAIDAVERSAASDRPIDLVLMDVQMPGMSGHEAARILRQRWDARTLPIVALTAAALVSERDQALAAGMNEFLTKPIDGGRLREALMRQLAGVIG